MAEASASSRSTAPDAATIRAFFAIELDPSVRAAAASVGAALRSAPEGDRVRWVRAENLHVTLRFLGNIDPERVPALVLAVREQSAAVRPFRLSLGETRVFPSPRNPRVIALEIAPEAELTTLAEAVERGTCAAGLPPERRRFRAHLTLGRLPGRRYPAPDAAKPAAADCAVAETVLFQSHLERSGAHYRALERIPLGTREGVTGVSG